MSNGQITQKGFRAVEHYAEEVDAAIMSYCGISLYDLTPVDLSHMQERGVSPKAAARVIIQSAHQDGEV
jgi:hypothetical protein